MSNQHDTHKKTRYKDGPTAVVHKKPQKSPLPEHTGLTALVGALLIALLALFSVIAPDREYSASENRKLAAFPEFSFEALTNGKFFSGLDTWMSDQFLFRDGFVSLKSTEDWLMGSRISHGVYIGKQKYLLDEPVTPDYEKLNRTVQALSNFTGTYPGLSARMMVIPCNAAINPNYLPASAPVRDQLDDLNGFAASLPASVTWVDPASALKLASGSQIYYRTDHHWTSLGAKSVFDSCAAGLGISSPITDYTHYQLSDSFLGTLASKSGHTGTKDPIDIYVPNTDVKYYVSVPDTGYSASTIYVKEMLDEKDQYQVFLGGNHPLVEIKTSALTERNLLLFKDSYANSFVQFLIPYYERIIMIDPRYYYDNLASVISSSSITDVLFLYSANTLFADSGLADCLNSVGSVEYSEVTATSEENTYEENAPEAPGTSEYSET